MSSPSVDSKIKRMFRFGRKGGSKTPPIPSTNTSPSDSDDTPPPPNSENPGISVTSPSQKESQSPHTQAQDTDTTPNDTSSQTSSTVNSSILNIEDDDPPTPTPKVTPLQIPRSNSSPLPPLSPAGNKTKSSGKTSPKPIVSLNSKSKKPRKSNSRSRIGVQMGKLGASMIPKRRSIDNRRTSSNGSLKQSSTPPESPKNNAPSGAFYNPNDTKNTLSFADSLSKLGVTKAEFKHILTENDHEILKIFLDRNFTLGELNLAPVAEALVTVFEEVKQTATLIHLITENEIKDATSVQTLFRVNSIGTKILKVYHQRAGKEYLEKVLLPHIHVILQQRKDCFEVDPNRIHDRVIISKNWSRLLSICDSILTEILDNIDSVPLTLRRIYHDVTRLVTKQFGVLDYPVSGGFFFLRFFCPAIVSPHLFKLFETAPNPEYFRAFTQISKIIQIIANGRRFPSNSTFYPANPFVERYEPKVMEFLSMISSPDSLSNPWGYPVISDKESNEAVAYLASLFVKYDDILMPCFHKAQTAIEKHSRVTQLKDDALLASLDDDDEPATISPMSDSTHAHDEIGLEIPDFVSSLGDDDDLFVMGPSFHFSSMATFSSSSSLEYQSSSSTFDSNSNDDPPQEPLEQGLLSLDEAAPPVVQPKSLDPFLQAQKNMPVHNRRPSLDGHMEQHPKLKSLSEQELSKVDSTILDNATLDKVTFHGSAGGSLIVTNFDIIGDSVVSEDSKTNNEVSNSLILTDSNPFGNLDE